MSYSFSHLMPIPKMFTLEKNLSKIFFKGALFYEKMKKTKRSTLSAFLKSFINIYVSIRSHKVQCHIKVRCHRVIPCDILPCDIVPCDS